MSILEVSSIAKRLTFVNLPYSTAPESTMNAEPRLQPKHLRTAEAALFAAFFERAEGKARRELMRPMYWRRVYYVSSGCATLGSNVGVSGADSGAMWGRGGLQETAIESNRWLRWLFLHWEGSTIYPESECE
jgi:hypothetical protein